MLASLAVGWGLREVAQLTVLESTCFMTPCFTKSSYSSALVLTPAIAAMVAFAWSFTSSCEQKQGTEKSVLDLVSWPVLFKPTLQVSEA